MGSDQFTLHRRWRRMKDHLPAGEIDVRIGINRRDELHRLPHRLTKALAVSLVAEVLCQLIPRNDLPLVGADPWEAIGKIGIEIERRWRPFKLPDRYFV